MTAPADDDLALVRRQASEALRALLRPGTYLGSARELGLAAVSVTMYPLGLLPDADLRGRRYGEAAGAAAAPAPGARLPVVLVHGYIHNRSGFLAMRRALRRAGFEHVHAFNYNPFAHDLSALGGMLAGRVEQVLAATGAERCTLVAHSMGGLVARAYLQERGGAETVDTLVTLGTPHRGTFFAWCGVGLACAQLRPGSDFLRNLEASAAPSPVRHVCYWSDLDATIVPAVSAKLVHPVLRATNIRVRDTGHVSLLLSGEVLRGVVAHLTDPQLNRPVPVEGPH